MSKQNSESKKIEDKWIKKWREEKIFEPSPSSKKKFYLTVAFPYPSGAMHVGHGRTYTVPDVIARFKRMQGYNVLFPMAWHVTGSPVLGIAKRIEKKDEKTIKLYRDLYKVPSDVMGRFTDPKEIVRHFSSEYKSDMTNLGFSIDWSREFLTITPQYQRFILWQYRKLRSLGLVNKGQHPVRFCPSCDNPVGDHDLLQGEAATINEFTIIKFRFGDLILPAATLRPETVFGVTNMWVNPDVEYVKAKVNGETWVVSRQAIEKMRFQNKDVSEAGTIKGSEIMGNCTCLLDKREVPILPAKFVNPDYATGVVMSVPAHAPYDYVALKEVSDLEVIPIIDVSGYGDVPARDVVERMNIKSQTDKKLEDATEELYRAEHSKGVMKKGIEGYGGMRVSDARKKVIDELAENGDLFYESSEAIMCRCGTKGVIKILNDQWFLRYSDEKWKEKVRECMGNMQIVPPEMRQNFEYFIGWLDDWACTRKIGLGTRLPWDDKWLIEPLSDSTIYMAFYTISRHIKEIDPQKLDDDFFEYVFLGKGDKKSAAKSSAITVKKLDEIRAEFLYWYPMDFRLSAKDLVGNHLCFMMFHHSAVFPKDKWPKGIIVFGIGLLEGNKMSSSKGNVVLLSDAMENYGSDAVRLFLMSNAEPWQDFDWRDNLVKSTWKKLKQFSDFVEGAGGTKDMPLRDIDIWLSNRMQNAILKTTDALEKFQTRKALQHAFFEMLNDVSWYTRRCKPNGSVLGEFTKNWVLLMAPFTPFACEELWEKAGGKMVSVAGYPVFDEKKSNPGIDAAEDLVKGMVSDINSILEVTKAKPNNIHLYLAEGWKRELFSQIKEGKNIGEIMKNPILKRYGNEVAKIVQKTRPEEIHAVQSLGDEQKTLSGASEFLEKEFACSFVIHTTADYDPAGKARHAVPARPAIYIE